MNPKNRDKIKAVIFDVGGVLALNKNPIFIRGADKRASFRSFGVHQYIAKKLKISLDQWFDSADKAYLLSFEGKISYDKTMELISKNTRTTKEKLKKILVNAYRKNFNQNKKVHKLAANLKKKGYKIAVLSDQWYPSKEAVVFRKYYNKFDAVILSCDVGIRKPDIRIYKLTLKKLKIPAQNVLFIDNQIWNLEPAKKLGMKTLLFKNNKQLFKDLKKFEL